MRWLLMVVALVACGGGGDPPRDAALAPELGVTDSTGTAVQSIELADTLVGQAASGALRVANIGSAATGPLAISISGAAANDFVLDNALTTCAARSLAPGEACDIVVNFRPMASGDREAVLVIASNPGGEAMVALKGKGVMPDLHFNPTSLAFGQLEVGKSSQTTIELRNDGPISVPLNAITVSGAAFTKGFATCGATLAANSSCDITVTAAPQALGAIAGSISVTSGNDVFSAPLSTSGARRVTVTSDGTGSGTISSAPSGINCGGTCTALFEGPVTLTAAPGASVQITSWSIPSCGQASSCVVPADTTPITVNVSWALTGSATLNVTFVGNGVGEVQVTKIGTGVLATCASSCTVPINAGDSIRMRAATFSSFSGFSSGCTSATAECSFTANPGQTSVNVGIAKDPKEQWTRLLPGTTLRSVAFDGSGNVIVASSTKLVKLSSTGSTVWTLDMNVLGLDTGPNDTIYVVTSGAELKKLAADGSEVWSRTAVSVCTRARGVSVAADGSVAVRSQGGTVSRWTDAGAPVWSTTVGSTIHWCSVAHDASGNVLVDVPNPNNGETTNLRRFTPAGTELTFVENASFEYHGVFSSNAAGATALCTSGHGRSLLNGPGVSKVIDIPGAGSAPNWCAMAGSDVAWVYQPDEQAGPPLEWRGQRYGTGTADLWNVHRPILRANTERYGTAPFHMAGAANGRIAVVGHYYGITTTSAWVQVFDP